MAFIAAAELLGEVLVVAQLGLLGELVIGGSVRVVGEGFEGLGACLRDVLKWPQLKLSIADFIGYNRLGRSCRACAC